MSTLFPTTDDDATDTPADRPNVKVVRALELYGYRADVVRTWSAAKANTVLNSCKKEEAVALRRAEGKARAEDGVPRGQPGLVERLAAALSLEESLGDGPEELCQAVAYTVHCLTDGELKRLAGYLIRTYRGERS